MKQRNYYVVSTNVWRDVNSDYLIPIMKSKHIVLMGWSSNYKNGHMFNNVKKNDVILVARRQNKEFRYYFIGVVASDETTQYWDDEQEKNAQCKILSYFIDLGNCENDILKGWSTAGSNQIPAIGRIDGDKNPEIITLIVNIINKQIQMQEIQQLTTLLSHKKNIILQGAPGVGKTYTTAALALSICGENVPDDHDSVMKRYEELQKDGRIGFVTFHQSMDYEDFVEGIKPSTDNGTITYDVEDGVFKQMCIKALSENNFDEVYAKFISAIEDYNEENPFKLKTPSGSLFAVFVNSKGNLALCAGASLKKYAVLTKENLRSFFIDTASVTYYKSYFKSVITHLVANFNLKNTKNEKKNYVLIIDEINRGNVSKIFGELITLLEADKRIGGKHPLKVTLPYSKDEFGVPSNLYIIGTMNTTDRSVGNIDYAVRRRFAFVTLESKREIVEQYSTVKAVNLFDAVKTFIENNKIEMDFDDLMVGHSYFLAADDDELQMKWQYEIMPLLREYHKDGLLNQEVTAKTFEKFINETNNN